MFSQLRLFLFSVVSLLVVTVAEKVLFAVYHQQVRSGLSLGEILYALVWGLRFDLAVAAGLAFFVYLIAYLLFRTLRHPFPSLLRHLTFVAGVLLVLVHGADLLYFDEAGRHLGYELREWQNSGTALAIAAWESYALPVALQLLLVPLLFFGVRFAFARPISPPPATGWRRIAPELQLLAVLLIGVVLTRGGLQSVPLEPLHAQQIGNSRQAALALNGSYNALFSSVTPYSAKAVLSGEPSPQELEAVRSLYPPRKGTASAPRPYNVVMIFLESWTAGFTDSYGGSWRATPFFDELRRESLTSLRTLAGGKRTTEGMFATLCSAQNPLGQTVAQTQLQNYDYDCLPELMAAQGYASAFFQGTLENTSGTGAFAKLLGFQESYGLKDITERRYQTNSWGVHDPDLYDFTLTRLKKLPQPFLVGINSNSTHDNRLPAGVEPAFPGDSKEEKYLNTLHFADKALGDFVEAIQSDPALAGNTLFVLVGDHTGLVRGSAMDGYSVPFLIHGPGVPPRAINAVTSQRDIAPTLLDLLGLETPVWFTGQSLLGPEPPRRFADFYHSGLLGWVEGDRLLTLNINDPQQRNCFDYRNDSPLRSPKPCGLEDEAMAGHAMGFTRLSQWLLFSGQTWRFKASDTAPQRDESTHLAR